MKPMTVAGAVVCWGVLFVGCAPAVEPTPSPEPSPVPTFQCTPEAGGEAYACDQAEHERMVARDEQYAEAERVYRRATAVAQELRSQKQLMNDELGSLTTDESRMSFEEALVATQQSDAIWEGSSRIEWVRRAPGIANEGSNVALEVCTSPGDLTVTSGDSTATPGTYFEQVFFRKEGGTLKMSSSKTSEVESCWQE